MGVLVLGALDRSRARCGRVEHLDRAVPLQGASKRAGDRANRHVRPHPADRDQRRAGGRRVQAAAGLELERELPCDCGRERLISLQELDERAARQAKERRVAHGLDGRRARRARQECELADRRTRAEDAERSLLAAGLRDDAETSTDDDVQVVGFVSFAEQPVAGEQPERTGVRGKVGQSLLARACEQRHALKRRPRDVRRAHRGRPSIGRVYGANAAKRNGQGRRAGPARLVT